MLTLECQSHQACLQLCVIEKTLAPTPMRPATRDMQGNRDKER